MWNDIRVWTREFRRRGHWWVSSCQKSVTAWMQGLISRGMSRVSFHKWYGSHWCWLFFETFVIESRDNMGGYHEESLWLPLILGETRCGERGREHDFQLSASYSVVWETEDTKKVSDPGIIQLGGIKYMIHRTQKRGLDPLLGKARSQQCRGGLALEGAVIEPYQARGGREPSVRIIKAPITESQLKKPCR